MLAQCTGKPKWSFTHHHSEENDLITVVTFVSEAPVFSSIIVSLDNFNNNNGHNVIVGAGSTVEEVVSGGTICEINPLDKIGVAGVDVLLLLSFAVTL